MIDTVFQRTDVKEMCKSLGTWSEINLPHLVACNIYIGTKYLRMDQVNFVKDSL